MAENGVKTLIVCDKGSTETGGKEDNSLLQSSRFLQAGSEKS